MPNKIYPVDIGSQLQVETPNLGRASGGLGGRLPSLNLNPLIALQAKLAEKEYDARMKRILDRDASVADILNSKKGANDINSFYGTEAQFNPYQEGILRKNMEAIQDVALNYSKQDVKSLSGYSDNEFRVKVDKLRNDPSVMGVLREAIELDAFTKANKGNAYHPVLKAKIDEIAHNEDGNTKGAWDYLHNADRYKLTEVDESKDIDALSKFAVDTISKTPVEGMIQTSKTMIPASTRSFIKQKYGKNFINDYEMGSSYTGDARAIPEGMTVDQYVDYRTEQMAKKYDAAVDKTLQSDPVWQHGAKWVEENQRHINDLKEEQDRFNKDTTRDAARRKHDEEMSKAKTARTEGFVEGLKKLGEDKLKKIKEKNPDLEDNDIIAASEKINKKGKTEEDIKKLVEEKVRETRVNVSSEVMTAKTENINSVVKNAKKNEVDGTFDQDVTFRIAGNDGDHSLAKESSLQTTNRKYPLPSDNYKITIFEKATDQVIRGGKRYTEGFILTTNKEYYDSLPDYYKTAEYKKQTGVGKVSPEELKKVTKEPLADAEYYRVPIEIAEPKTKTSLGFNIPDSLSTFTTSTSTSLAGKNNNPGNIRPKGDTNSFVKFNSLEEGFNAMVEDLSKKISDDTPALIASKKRRGREGQPTTIADLIETWSPIETETEKTGNSNEVVDNYINSVSETLGVPSDTPIADLDVKELALALAKHEDPNVYEEVVTMLQKNTGGSSDVANKSSTPPKINTDETQKQAQKEKPKVETKKDTVKRKKIVFE